ncbi:MAG: hypothetical protein ACLPKB_07000 [Xanthobacteraceae bacterium]
MIGAHRLIGYDRKTDEQKFSLSIPQSQFRAVTSVVRFEPDDPKAFDSYQLEYSQARDIAGMLAKHDLPKELDHYLEYFAQRSKD